MGQQPPKKTAEEKDAEFVGNIERLLGFPLMKWQLPLMAKIRKSVESNKELEKGALCTCLPGTYNTPGFRHPSTCPERGRTT